MFKKLAPSLLYMPVMLLCIAIVFASVFSYAWASTLINLSCSIQDDSFYYSYLPGMKAMALVSHSAVRRHRDFSPCMSCC